MYTILQLWFCYSARKFVVIVAISDYFLYLPDLYILVYKSYYYAVFLDNAKGYL